MDDVLENLKNLCTEHEKHLSALRSKIREIDILPRARALVGKCFKYRDSSGMFSNRVTWVFKRVVDADGETIIVDTFQIDTKINRIVIDVGVRESAQYFGHHNFTEITHKKFVKAYMDMVRNIAKFGKQRGYNGK